MGEWRWKQEFCQQESEKLKTVMCKGEEKCIRTPFSTSPSPVPESILLVVLGKFHAPLLCCGGKKTESSL